MERYFLFIFQRTGAPLPVAPIVVRHPLEWVNRIVVEDCEAVFHGAHVRFQAIEDDLDGDLLILPFLENLLVEYGNDGRLYRALKRRRTTPWIMLYGLKYRRIELVPAGKLYTYYQQRRLFIRIRQWLQKYQFWRLIRLSVKFWARRYT